MAAIHPTSERLSVRCPCVPVSCAVIGDSSINTINDVPGSLERLPPTLPRLVLHVGTADIADNGCAQAVRNLKELVERIHQIRPNLKLCISLPLPTAPNRRRGGANKIFVHWFNRGASPFVRQVRRLCYRGELGRGVFYLDHAFHEMPLWRVLATDGLDPSYKGVAMLALHFRELLTTKTSRWHPQNLQPAENAAPVCAGSPAPAANMVCANSSSPQNSVPPAPRPVTSPTSPTMAYNLRTFSEVARRPARSNAK
ncbi:hypothetical protein HPB51_007539 [Rhipicephalus microplus]|uniref:Uncharacterized protein n=1 Tax=Rhipicephalus microplus TaxID=6941 RepID=A0A9J6ERY1_RHIMP|nr:hypothetical protein HPB51_007539 [Rhipicephalus microplus]